jgi:hypothetical protein
VNKKCKPLRREGNRNDFCPFYNDCLDHAVRESWEQWTCLECSQQFNQEARPELQLTVAYSVAYYDLMLK